MKPRYLHPPPPRYHFTNSRRLHVDIVPQRRSARRPFTVALCVMCALTAAAVAVLITLVWLNR